MIRTKQKKDAMMQVREWAGRLTFRLFVSHVAVAVVTGLALTLFFFLLIFQSIQQPPYEAYRATAFNYGMSWLAGMPSGLPTDPDIDPMPGWTLIVDMDADEVVWSRGDTICEAGSRLSACADWVQRPTEPGFTEIGDEAWAWVEEIMITGQHVVMLRGPITAEPMLVYGEVVVEGYSALLALEMVSRGVMAVPVALLLAWWFTRPVTRRIQAMIKTSRRFAQGDLSARIGDPHTDDLGRLAQQFDDMASALTQNITGLHDLAQRNADLAERAEWSAIAAERSRISRELHDAVAQRLFSLSVSTTALPALIAQNAERGAAQAQTIAEMAEQTLLDLRALLVEMRPPQVAQRGLAESLRGLFRQWEALNGVLVEADLMLSGKHLPNVIEDAVYQITQEALSNIARHAHAKTVEISLVEGQNQLILSITDDGRGFDAELNGRGGGFGLVSMRERAHALGGQFSIDSQAGRGTTVQVTLSIKREQGA